MNNFDKHLKDFRKGKVLSNEKLITLHDGLVDIETTLQGKGDLFATSKLFAQHILNSVNSILLERGVRF